MSIAVTDPGAVSEAAATTIDKILHALEDGPACPCQVVVRVGRSESVLLPFLSEILAREWATVLVPDRDLPAFASGDGDFGKSTAYIAKLVDIVREQQACLDGTDHTALRDGTILWHRFLTQLATENLTSRIALGLTAQGQEEATALDW